MNIRKIISIILVLAMVLSLSVGCTKEETYTVMDEIALDFDLTQIDNDVFKVQHPTDTWTYDDTFASGFPTFFETASLIPDTFTNNVNFVVAGPSDEPMSKDAADEILTASESSFKAQGIVIESSDVKKLGDTVILYLEQIATVTDELIDLTIAEGVFTEEMIEAMGGRDALKKPVTSIAFYTVIDGNVLIITGTYEGATGKATVLDMMKIFVQTIEYK